MELGGGVEDSTTSFFNLGGQVELDRAIFVEGWWGQLVGREIVVNPLRVGRDLSGKLSDSGCHDLWEVEDPLMWTAL
jgi:hypothetical protein